MALITCKECGQQISDKATTCIHCGCPLSEMGASGDTDYSNKSNVSSEDLQNDNSIAENENANDCEQQILQDDCNKKQRKKFKLKKVIISLCSVLLIALTGVGGYFFYESRQMSTLDQSIYDALVIATQDMKNPTGLQILQIGTVRKNDNDGKMISCIIKVQSTTSLGAINTDEILLTNDGTFATTKDWKTGILSVFADSMNDMYNINDNNENVDIKKINSALKRHWKDLGIE